MKYTIEVRYYNSFRAWQWRVLSQEKTSILGEQAQLASGLDYWSRWTAKRRAQWWARKLSRAARKADSPETYTYEVK